MSNRSPVRGEGIADTADGEPEGTGNVHVAWLESNFEGGHVVHTFSYRRSPAHEVLDYGG